MATQDTLHIQAGGTLELPSGNSTPIQFDGPDATLAVEPGVVASGVISGFAATDRIHFIGPDITRIDVVSQADSARLTAYRGDQVADTLTFQGALPSLSVTMDPTGATIAAAAPATPFVATASSNTIDLGLSYPHQAGPDWWHSVLGIG